MIARNIYLQAYPPEISERAGNGGHGGRRELSVYGAPVRCDEGVKH
jgi:hypothetical protein